MHGSITNYLYLTIFCKVFSYAWIDHKLSLLDNFLLRFFLVTFFRDNNGICVSVSKKNWQLMHSTVGVTTTYDALTDIERATTLLRPQLTILCYLCHYLYSRRWLVLLISLVEKNLYHHITVHQSPSYFHLCIDSSLLCVLFFYLQCLFTFFSVTGTMVNYSNYNLFTKTILI